MLNDIKPFFNINFNKTQNYIPKKNSPELISPINYSWKKLFIIMNKVKFIWRTNPNKFDNGFILDIQALNKCLYTNLKCCENQPSHRLKNNILESDINSFFQTILFEYSSEEQEVYDYYEKMFSQKKYIPRKKEEEESLFGYFITNYKDFFYKIQKNKKSMRQLKKLRWYMVMDEDNFVGEEPKNNNSFNINNNNFFLDFSKEIDNNNDSFDEFETKIVYDEYKQKEEEKPIDDLEELLEKNIINDELVNKLLNKEINPIFYIIKLIYLSVSTFCKGAICHLLNSFSDLKEPKCEEGKFLINEYLLCFNNFVDSCITINKKCENINVVMNFLYNSLFEKYPDFPKFSIFRMCIRIWFTEANTFLIGKSTLLSTIKNKLSSIFENNLKDELLYKMEDNLKNNNSFNSKSVNFDKNKSFGLTSSFMLFKSDNLNFKTNNGNFPFGSNFINNYNNSDKQYKILDKGLSIINDTFSNEYSVFLLNLSSIDANSLYMEVLENFKFSIRQYISKLFDIFLYEKNYDVKELIDNIFIFFDNYFFKTRIIPKLRKEIFDTVHSELKSNFF